MLRSTFIVIAVAVLCVYVGWTHLDIARKDLSFAREHEGDLRVYSRYSDLANLRTGVGGIYGTMLLLCVALLAVINGLSGKLRQQEGRIAKLEEELRRLGGAGS
jgi:hypothetical protein